MAFVESGKENPGPFRITENPEGLKPGNYLITDIQIFDWVEEEQDLNSPVRKRLAAWAQQIAPEIEGPFSLTCAAQTEAGFAIFKITPGRAKERDLYWFNPEKDEVPPPDTEEREIHLIIED